MFLPYSRLPDDHLRRGRHLHRTGCPAVVVLYAVVVEIFLYRHIGWRDLYRIALSTGIVTAVVFILVAVGASFL